MQFLFSPFKHEHVQCVFPPLNMNMYMYIYDEKTPYSSISNLHKELEPV